LPRWRARERCEGQEDREREKREGCADKGRVSQMMQAEVDASKGHSREEGARVKREREAVAARDARARGAHAELNPRSPTVV